MASAVGEADPFSMCDTSQSSDNRVEGPKRKLQLCTRCEYIKRQGEGGTRVQRRVQVREVREIGAWECEGPTRMAGKERKEEGEDEWREVEGGRGKGCCWLERC